MPDFITYPDTSTNTGPNLWTAKQTISGTDVNAPIHAITDASSNVQAKVQTSSPAGTEGALVTRPITASGSLTNRSGSITTGGTAQSLASSNSTRRYLLIQNISDTDMWFNFGTTAVADQPSLKLLAGQSFAMEGSFISTESISIICATTGKKFTAKEA